MIGTERLAQRPTRFSYLVLEREVNRRITRHTFYEGQGAPLLFLWAVGLAVFLVPLDAPLLVIPWSGLAVGIGWLMVRDAQRNQALRARLTGALLEQRFPASVFADPMLRARVGRGQALFVEISIKVAEAAGHADRPSRNHVLAHACEMVAMQYQTARQTHEFARVLEIAGEGGQGRGKSPTTVSLLDANAAAISREIERVADLSDEIGRQLQTLLLQLAQLDVRAIDMVRAAEFARQARESLEQMQAEVSIQREVAERVIADLAPLPLEEGTTGTRKEIDR